MAKATKRQMLERREDVMAKIKEGLDVNDYVQELAYKHKCSEISIRRVYSAVMDELIEVNKEKQDELRIKLMSRVDMVYEVAKKHNNIKGLLSSIDLHAKIGGVYTPRKQEAEKKKAPVFRFVANDSALSVVPGEEDGSDENN